MHVREFVYARACMFVNVSVCMFACVHAHVNVSVSVNEGLVEVFSVEVVVKKGHGHPSI